MHHLAHYKKASRVLRLSAVAQASAVLLVCMGSQVHALGFGRVHVHSALGQPLRAEIELNGIQGDTVQAGLAPASAYAQRNLEYSPVVGDIRSQLTQTADGRVLMRLQSSRPIAEPFVDLVIRATDAGGHVVKDVSLLLDPPGKPVSVAQQHPGTMASGQPGRVQPTEHAGVPEQGGYYSPPAQRSASRHVPADAPAARSRRGYSAYAEYDADDADVAPVRKKEVRRRVDAGQVAAQAMRRSRVKSGHYAGVPRSVKGQRRMPAHSLRVRYGQTASGIALSQRQPGATLSQMLVALVQANPHAFIDGNVHRLKAGAILHMPTREQVQAISAVEARQMLARNQGVVTYQSRMTHAPVTLEKPGKAAYTVTDTPSRASMAASTQQPAVAVTSSSSTSDTAASRVAVRPEVVEDVAATHTPPVVVTSVPLVASSAAKAAAQLASAVQVPDVAVAPASAAVEQAAIPLPVASVTETNLTPKEAAESVEDPNELPPLPPGLSSIASAVDAPVVHEPVAESASADKQHREPADGSSSYLQSLFDDPLILGGGVALLALLGGWGYMQVRRRRADRSRWMSIDKEKTRDSVQFELTGFARPGNGEGRLSELTQMQNGGEFMYSAMEYSHSQLRHAGDEIDAVMEADVYLAYGRDTQAEEILKDAINNRPTWVAAHAKLLEIYRSRRDATAYAETAATVKALTHAQGAEWALARSNGLALDPDNPLYQEDPAEEVDQGVTAGNAVPVAAVMAASAQAIADADTISEGGIQKEVESTGPDFLLDDAEPPVHTTATTSGSAEAAPLAFDRDMSFNAAPEAAAHPFAPSSSPFGYGAAEITATPVVADPRVSMGADAFPDTSLLALSGQPGAIGSSTMTSSTPYTGVMGSHAPVGQTREPMPWELDHQTHPVSTTEEQRAMAGLSEQPDWMATTSTFHVRDAATAEALAGSAAVVQPVLQQQPVTAWSSAGTDVSGAGIPEPVLDWNQASDRGAAIVPQQPAPWQSDTVMLTDSDVMLSARASELLKSARAQYGQSADQQPDLDISLDLSDISASDVVAGIPQQTLAEQQAVPSFLQPATSVEDLSADLVALTNEMALLGQQQSRQQPSSHVAQSSSSVAATTAYSAEQGQEGVRRAPSFADGTMVHDASSTLQTAVPGRTGVQGSPFLGQLLGAMRTPADLHPKGHVSVPPTARDEQQR